MAATVPARQNPSASWPDPSKHQRRFVTVEKGVNLEVLDWGGSGRPIILLAGSGNTAHVFDEFASMITDCCHVCAITRRGYGSSSRPATGYDDQRLADDIFQVIEREKIKAPVLVGHSMSGGEMTTLGRQHSDRLGGLIYLDALGDLEDDPPADKEWMALQQKLPPGLFPQPKCVPIDKSTFTAYRRTSACSMGFTFPESELRNIFDSVDGRVGEPKSPDWVSRAIGQGQVFRRDYSNIRVPVLALMNGAMTTEEVLSASGYQPKNDDEREAIDRFMARSRIVFGRWTDKLKCHVPDARVRYYPLAGHYIFMTREAEVLREIHTFVAGLASTAK
jgi:non-heme chloroperoxidase